MKITKKRWAWKAYHLRRKNFHKQYYHRPDSNKIDLRNYWKGVRTKERQALLNETEFPGHHKHALSYNYC